MSGIRRSSATREIYEIMEQQKKLDSLMVKITTAVEKVNHKINGITVENLQLTRSEFADDNVFKVDITDKVMLNEEKTVKIIKKEENYPSNDNDPASVNKQFLDIKVKNADYNEELESEDELIQF